MGRGLFSLAFGLISAAAPASLILPTASAGGECVSVQKIIGTPLLPGQDAGSVQEKEGSGLASVDTTQYVRMRTRWRRRKSTYHFEFSMPSGLAGTPTTATSITVEMSVMVQRGTGREWSVDIMNRGQNGGWETIGDLSQATTESGWTTIQLTPTGGDPTDYLNPSSNDQILVRVFSTVRAQLVEMDFMQITASRSPTAPAPTPEIIFLDSSTPEPTAESNVGWVARVSGEELEGGQNQDSVKSIEASSNTADYVRIKTIAGVGEYEFYFSAPPLFAGEVPAVVTYTVEFLVKVVDGSGSSWAVEILNRGQTLEWNSVGDLSDAGSNSDWTTVTLTITSDDPTEYLDAASDNQILVRVISKSTAQNPTTTYIDFVEVTAAAGGSLPEPTTVGNAVWVERVSGEELDDSQNSDSLKNVEGSSNAANYLPIQTIAGVGEYEFYFSAPPLFAGGVPVAAVFTVEFVVAVVGGSGSSWVVEFLNRGETLAWEMIGDLSDAGSDSDWTKVSVATKSDDPTEWMDADSANTILVRVRSKSTAQDPTIAHIDFMAVTAVVGEAPTPAPVAPPTAAPVLAPIEPPPVGSQQRWAAFAQFVPNWEDFKAKRGNGVCDPLEECRTDSACCGASFAAARCGNGLCEEGENRANCTKDCTHHLSICGNGICESWATSTVGFYHISMGEDEFSCPVDCLSSPNLDVSSPVTGSCFMSGSTCDNICGDGICAGTDTCVTCPRDCGECLPESGDGICSYPFEAGSVGDCGGSSITNYITYKGEDYASIENSDPLDGEYTEASCTSSPLSVPAGWRLADWDADIAKELVLDQGAKFDTGCLVFDEGNAASTDDGLQRDAWTGCGVIPLVRYNGNKFAIGPENCPSRLMIQRIKASGTKTCPSCGNGGLCNTVTGKCACLGLWTGPTCDRAIGDLSVPPAASSWYKPALGTTWDWQLDGASIPGANGEGSLHDVELYDIDYTYSSAVIADLQSKGKKVMCYISAGTSENFRDDFNLFAEEAQGSIVSFAEGDVFPDERWLDLRRLDLVAPIMLERLDIMKAKGCDAVEWDNADLPVHVLGLSGDGMVSVSVQIAYNAWIAAQTHARGMGVAMKNNNEAAAFHVDDYDMVVNEECWIFGTCSNYWPWINAGKPVLNTEYFTARCMYCTQAEMMKMSTIKKVPNLTSCMVDCKSGFDSAPCSAASVSGTVSYPIDWTVGAGAKMNEDWCPMTANTDADECPSERFAECYPFVGY